MMAKFGFLLLLGVFGSLMFLCGVLAPESVRLPVSGAAAQTLARAESVLGRARPAASGAAATTAGAPAAPSAKEGPPPVPAEQLLLPAPLPEKGRFAVEAGRFTDAQPAQELGKRLQSLRLPVEKVIEAVDQGGAHWWIVPVGPYASPAEARAARVRVAQELQVDSLLPLMMLPAPPPTS
jgi:cell division protein FtsN